MNKMTTIYFVRHCEPTRGANSEFTDRTYPLSQKGQQDRALVTEFLADKGVDVVLSSPFTRAVETVAEFAQRFQHSIETIEDLRERAIADTWIDNFREFSQNQWTDFTHKLPGGECLAEVQARSVAALMEILARFGGKTIAIGTHGTSLSTIINHFDASYGYDDFMAMAHLMPWVAKMVFDGNRLVEVEKTDLFTCDAHVSPADTLFYKADDIRVETANIGELGGYKYTVIFARQNGKWLYCRHKARQVYETAGGKIEAGETPLECAKRELVEEMGAVEFTIVPAFDYAVYRNGVFGDSGQVFIADITQLGGLHFEMAEVRGFDTIPDKMRFPQILPVLFERIK